MNPADARSLDHLLRGSRWAALATQGTDGPLASMVAYAATPDLCTFILHLSALARHTANLLASPVASLVVGQPDVAVEDPQTLARVTLTGTVRPVPREAADYEELRGLYLRRLPTAEPLFGFADFTLFRLRPRQVHYVGGFARAYPMDLDEFRREVAKVPVTRPADHAR